MSRSLYRCVKRARGVAVLAALLSLGIASSGWSAAQDSTVLAAPTTTGEKAGLAGRDPSPEGVFARKRMVASGNPIASKVGVDIMRQGGNAVDAAVAVEIVLSFVAAPSTGIGGGGFLLFRDAGTGESVVYDGREMAPHAMRRNDFMLGLGVPMPWWFAVISGYGVGVPGTVAMLYKAHQEHGKLPWAELLKPTIDMAEHGIPMPLRLRVQLSRDPSLFMFDDLDRTFVVPGKAEHPVLINKALAKTLRRVAKEGPAGFYSGEIPAQIVAAARERTLLGSDIAVSDFKRYEAVKRPALCGNYRQWTLCGPPPPSGGGLGVLQILGILEAFDMGSLGPDSVEALHLFAEANRLALADVYQYVGDPAFVDVPVDDLLEESYLAARARLVDARSSLADVKPGRPPESLWQSAANLTDKPLFGTSHFSVIDDEGNVVALTNSNASPFGSRAMAAGFVLNNQLTDFTFDPIENGRPVANAPAAGKRPRSSMAPMVVLDAQGEVVLVIGSRGGGRIPGYVAKVLVGVLDWGLTVQEAIDLPNIIHRGDELEVEEGKIDPVLVGRLKGLGHTVDVRELTSGLHGIERVPGGQRSGDRLSGGWRAGVDTRVQGAAAGD